MIFIRDALFLLTLKPPIMEDYQQEITDLRKQLADMKAKAERYDSAGLGDIVARLESIEKRLTPPPTAHELKVKRLVEKFGKSREEAEKLIKDTDDFFRRRYGNKTTL